MKDQPLTPQTPLNNKEEIKNNEIPPDISKKEYLYMQILQKIFKAPALLMHCRKITILRRKTLLKRWQEDRVRFLFENCHEMDYMKDRQMDQLIRCSRKIDASPSQYE